MAKPRDPIDEQVNEAVGDPADVLETEDRQPLYQMVGDSKIPVSKSYGKLWKYRLGQGKQARRKNGVETAWDEAVRYFNNDQSSHRRDGDDDGAGVVRSGNGRNALSVGAEHTETENIVFSNTVSVLPTLYARNPTVTIDSNTEDEDEKPIAKTCEKLINTLFSKKSAPGINLKPRVRRATLHTMLMNQGWLEIGYTLKENSSEQALEEIQKLSKELENAKDGKAIEEIEGKLMALEKKIDLLQASGPWCKCVHPKDIVIDPAAELDDLSQHCNWVMRRDMLPLNFVKACYLKDDEHYIYEPTHIIKSSHEDGTGHEELSSFSLFEGNDKSEYGYDDDEAFESAKYLECWYVWDKTTRRVFLYSAKDWTWPLWVWDDPYKLSRFFPFYSISFYDPIEGVHAKGEVSYYLDQQDAINDINTIQHKARNWAALKILFDKNATDQQSVEAFLRGNDVNVLGIDLQEDKKIGDVISGTPHPSLNFLQMFDKSGQYAAIDRISSVNATIRGEQYKTNTTNENARRYELATGTRIDDKTDRITDVIGEVAKGILEMCVQHMSRQEVHDLIGAKFAQYWTNMDVRTFNSKFSLEIIGGSTQKPTSQVKKEMALEIGQILGQFTQVSPIVLLVMLRVLSRAFDEVVIEDQEWQMIIDSISSAMQQPQQPQGSGPDSGQPAQLPNGAAALQQALMQYQ
jgi:hypothetical protein